MTIIAIYYKGHPLDFPSGKGWIYSKETTINKLRDWILSCLQQIPYSVRKHRDRLALIVKCSCGWYFGVWIISALFLFAIIWFFPAEEIRTVSDNNIQKVTNAQLLPIILVMGVTGILGMIISAGQDHGDYWKPPTMINGAYYPGYMKYIFEGAAFGLCGYGLLVILNRLVSTSVNIYHFPVLITVGITSGYLGPKLINRIGAYVFTCEKEPPKKQDEIARFTGHSLLMQFSHYGSMPEARESMNKIKDFNIPDSKIYIYFATANRRCAMSNNKSITQKYKILLCKTSEEILLTAEACTKKDTDPSYVYTIQMDLASTYYLIYTLIQRIELPCIKKIKERYRRAALARLEIACLDQAYGGLRPYILGYDGHGFQELWECDDFEGEYISKNNQPTKLNKEEIDRINRAIGLKTADDAHYISLFKQLIHLSCTDFRIKPSNDSAHTTSKGDDLNAPDLFKCLCPKISESVLGGNALSDTALVTHYKEIWGSMQNIRKNLLPGSNN